jgi:hypothetical protein
MGTENLFTRVEDFIKAEPFGWCTVERGQILAASVLTLRPSTSIIIGVWSGRDMLSMAMAHKQINKGKVIGIDPWFAKVSVQGQVDAHARFWSNQDTHDDVYRSFLKSRNDLGLQDWAEVYRMPSNDFTPMDAGIVIIDGNHGPQAAIDAERYAPKVIMGGLLYLDDLEWPSGGVRAAERYALNSGFRKLYDLDGGALYQRVSL